MVASFPLGQIVATPGALAALERANQSPAVFLSRHAEGDWGELDPTDIAENAFSIAHGFRLLSSYETEAGERLWIITEADRSATTLLLPEEYWFVLIGCQSAPAHKTWKRLQFRAQLILCLEQTQHSHADGYSERNLVWLS
jgi:hypothetical protein